MYIDAFYCVWRKFRKTVSMLSKPVSPLNTTQVRKAESMLVSLLAARLKFHGPVEEFNMLIPSLGKKCFREGSPCRIHVTRIPTLRIAFVNFVPCPTEVNVTYSDQRPRIHQTVLCLVQRRIKLSGMMKIMGQV